MYNLSTINNYKLHNKNSPMENLLYYTEESIHYITEGAGLIAIIIALIAAIIAIVIIIIKKVGGGGGGGGKGASSSFNFISNLLKPNTESKITYESSYLFEDTAKKYKKDEVIKKRIELLKTYLKNNSIKLPCLKIKNYLQRSEAQNKAKESFTKIDNLLKNLSLDSSETILSTFCAVNNIYSYASPWNSEMDFWNNKQNEMKVIASDIELCNFKADATKKFSEIKDEIDSVIGMTKKNDVKTNYADTFEDKSLNDFDKIYDEISNYLDYEQNMKIVFKNGIINDLKTIESHLNNTDNDLKNASTPTNSKEFAFYIAKICLKMWKDCSETVSSCLTTFESSKITYITGINQIRPAFNGTDYEMSEDELKKNIDDMFGDYESFGKKEYGDRYTHAKS